MAANTFGERFRVTTAGASHGPGYVAIVDGCPAGLPLAVEDLLPDLARRRPGQSKIVTQRDESDAPEILSGIFEGRTDGTPIAILFRNGDQRSKDYGDIADKYRPGHADYTLRRQVRLPRLPGRRPEQRAGDRLPGGGRGHRQEDIGVEGNPRPRAT